MTRRTFLALMAASMLSCARREGAATSPTTPTTRRASRESRPNIVLFVADDLGYADLGCYGGRDVPTPNIDSLATNGVRFTDGYVTAPVCSPTRAGLLTGRYQQRFGHEFNPGSTAEENFGLPLDEVTLAQVLKQHGYATGMVGKWHLGLRPEYQPIDRGFDEYFGFLGGAHAYINLERPGAAPILRGRAPVSEREYLTDTFGREAADFVERHREHPFFLYNPYNAIHTPMQATPKYLQRFPNIRDERRRTMAAMLSALDDAIGRVMDKLRERDLERNTLVIFISDNGGPTPGNSSRNDPLSGFKGQLWEGGIRVPFIVQWKGHVPAGRVEHTPVNCLDIFATALAAADIPLPSNLEGHDLTRVEPRPLFWRFGEPCAVRAGNYKLLMLPQQEPKLFDLSRDPGEQNDLAKQQPERVKQLRAMYDEWNRHNVEPKWGRTRPRRRPRRREGAPQTRPATAPSR
jgi:arylsulfatase A-like enzyme